ncbi:MAG: hypothetical protein LJE83_10110 [Gammaproteobacteria bacterium]|nr:hypothetical protein [Gammaproteobacteria bacterium]
MTFKLPLIYGEYSTGKSRWLRVTAEAGLMGHSADWCLPHGAVTFSWLLYVYLARAQSTQRKQQTAGFKYKNQSLRALRE